MLKLAIHSFARKLLFFSIINTKACLFCFQALTAEPILINFGTEIDGTLVTVIR